MQLPSAGMKPMPKEYVPALTLPNVPQVFDPGGVATRPAGMAMPPALINADDAPGLVSVRVIDALAPVTTLVGANATVIDGVGTGVTVSVAVLLLALLPVGVETRLPGTTLTLKLPAVALRTGILMVQVPAGGMVAMPNEYVFAVTPPESAQVLVTLPEIFSGAVVPTLLPPSVVLINAGLVIVTTRVDAVPATTEVGENATVMVGVGAGRPLPLTAIMVGLVAALELMVIVPDSAPVALGAKLRFRTHELPGAILIGDPVLGAPPALEPNPQ